MSWGLRSQIQDLQRELASVREELARTREENARARAVADFLWRRVNPHAITEEQRIKFLEAQAFKPDFTSFVLWCGCKVFRDDSRVLCVSHAKERVAIHTPLSTGKTLPQHRAEAIAEDADRSRR